MAPGNMVSGSSNFYSITPCNEQVLVTLYYTGFANQPIYFKCPNYVSIVDGNLFHITNSPQSPAIWESNDNYTGSGELSFYIFIQCSPNVNSSLVLSSYFFENSTQTYATLTPNCSDVNMVVNEIPYSINTTNAIGLQASSLNPGSAQIGETISRQYQIIHNGGLNHFNLQYTPETDITVSQLELTQPGATNINISGAMSTGGINITPEQLQANNFNILQPFIISETGTGMCMQNASSGALTIQVNCTNACPSISASLSNVNVDILQPESTPVTASYESTTPLYCNNALKEVTLTLTVSNPKNNIQLVSIAIPFNNNIYNIVDVELNNNSLGGIYTYDNITHKIFIDFNAITDPVSFGLSTQISNFITNTNLPGPYVFLQHVNSFFLKIKFNFNCSTNTVIKSCHAGNSIIPSYPILTYRNICGLINPTNAIELPLPVVANSISSNSTHTIIPNDVDYGSLPAGGLTVNTEFNFMPSGFSAINTPFTIGNLYNCSDVSYTIRLSIPQNYILLSYIIQVGNPLVQYQFNTAPDPAANNIYYIPLTQIVNNQPVRLFAQLNIPSSATCPFGTNITYGTLPILAEVIATCNQTTCTDCYRVFACETAELNIHCPGDCGGTAIATNSFNIERITFGWNDKNDFLNNNAPITRNDLEAHYDLSNPQEAIAFHNQLHSVYQEDRIQVISTGYIISNINSISLEIAYPARNTFGQLYSLSGGTIFDYIVPVNGLCKFKFINPATNDEAEHTISSATTTGIVEINGTDFKTIVLTFSNSTVIGNLINSGYTNLRFEGIFTINKHANTIAQTYTMPSVRGQFLCSPVNSSLSTFSCDPYFSNLNMYILSHEILKTGEAGIAGFPLPHNGIYGSTNNFSQLWNDGSPHRLLLSPCIGRRSFAFRVFGGLGPGVDEFPHEYRPYFFIPNNTTQSANGIVPNSVTYNTQFYELTAPTPINLLHFNNWWEVSLNTPIVSTTNSETRHLEFNNNQRVYEKGEAIITTSNLTYEEVLDFIIPLRKRCTTTVDGLTLNLTIEHSAYARANLINNNNGFTNNHLVDLIVPITQSNNTGIETQINFNFYQQPYAPVPSNPPTYFINLLTTINYNTLPTNNSSPITINSINNELNIPFTLFFSTSTALENAWLCVTAPNGVQIEIINPNPTVAPTPTVNPNGILYFAGLQGSFNGNLHITVPCSLLNTANPVNGILASLDIELRYGNICNLPAGFDINNLTCNNLTTLNNCSGVGSRTIHINIMQPVINLSMSSLINNQNNCSHLQITATVTNPQTAPFGSPIMGQLHVSLPIGFGLNSSTSTITNNGTGITFSLEPSIFNAGSNSYSGYALPENGLAIAPGTNATYILIIAIPCSTNVTALLNSIFIGASTCNNLVTSDLLSAIQTLIQNNNTCCSNVSNDITYQVSGSCISGAQGNGAITIAINQTAPVTAYSFILTNQATNLPQATVSNITGTSYSFTNLPEGTYLLTVSDGTSTIQFDNIEVGASAQSCVVDVQFLNQSAASVSLLGYSQFDNTTGVIGINGTFTIDADFTIDGADIIMGPGATIIIQPGFTLTINESYIHGCCEMWNKIYVSPMNNSGDYASLIINNSTIEDANYAVQARNRSYLEIINNTFDKNFVGIHLLHSTGTVNAGEDATLYDNSMIAKNKFICATGNIYHYLKDDSFRITYAGILIHKFSFYLEGYNTFYGLRYGIYAINSLNLTIMSENKFRRIRNHVGNGGNIIIDKYGMAICDVYFPNQSISYNNSGSLEIFGTYGTFPDEPNLNDADFRNCRIGIYSQRNSLRIYSVQMNEVNRGILCEKSRFISAGIENCYIAASLQGIHFNTCEMMSGLKIYQNYIKMNSSDFNFPQANVNYCGIRINNTVANNTATTYINENKIEILNSLHGIELNNLNKVFVEANNIKLNNNSVAQKGLLINKCYSVAPHCNHIQGTLAPNAALQTSISSHYSSGVDAKCNEIGNTHYGIYINGSNPEMQLTSNKFNTHVLALYYTSMGSSGAQPARGNEWNGSYTSGVFFGAYSDNNDPIFVNNNNYTIPSLTSQYSPQRVYVNNVSYGPNATYLLADNDWFTPNGPNPTTCGNANTNDEYCTIEVPQMPVIQDSLSLAQINTALFGISNTGTGNTTQQWYSNRALWEALLNKPELLENETVSEWYSLMQYSSAAQHQSVSHAIQNSYRLNSSDSVFLAGYQQKKSKLDSILFNNMRLMQMSTISDSARLSIEASQRMVVDSNRALLLIFNTWVQHVKAQGVVRDSLLMINNLSIDTALHEWNEKTINKIYLNTLEQDIYELDSIQSFIVYAIAMQCPDYGGAAVYMARALYALVNDSLLFNDQLICAAAYRKEETVSSTVQNYFSLYPNPNTGIFNLSWVNHSRDEMVTLSVTDMYGRVILEKQINLLQNNQQVSLPDVPVGLYYAKVSGNGKVWYQSKVSITK